MKIAIVDDSMNDAQKLSDLIGQYCTETRLLLEVECYSGGAELLLAMQSGTSYDIVFLDIYMDGLTGMDTARRIRELEQECLLVFVTSSTSHAVESYRVRAFDYLTKPYTYDDLCEILRLCDKALLQRARYIQIKEGRVMVKVLLNDILYTDYYNHYIQIHTRDRIIRSYMPFAEFSHLLQPYPQFLCCYRNCMVNLDTVISMDQQDFIVENGERVPMARAQRTELRQLYADYAFSRLDGGI